MPFTALHSSSVQGQPPGSELPTMPEIVTITCPGRLPGQQVQYVQALHVESSARCLLKLKLSKVTDELPLPVPSPALVLATVGAVTYSVAPAQEATAIPLPIEKQSDFDTPAAKPRAVAVLPLCVSPLPAFSNILSVPLVAPACASATQ